MAGSAEVGRTEFGIYANTKPFDTTMNGLQAKAESIGKNISRKLAAGLSVAALTKFANDCLYQGSKLNAMRSMSSRAFEGMTDDLNNFAQNAATKFGLSEKMALQFAGTFGTMANSFGFTQKQAYDMSTALTGLAGDVASFYSMSQEEAFNKLQSVFTGETESLKSLGIVMSQNALDQYALANGFGKTTSQMSEQEKVALRYQFVLSQLSLAQGDFVRTSDAWGNQVKILKLNFQSLQAQIGIGLINVLKPAIKALNVFMAKLVQVATVFAQFTQTIFGKKATAGAKKLAVSTADVGTAADSAGTGLGSLGTSAGKAAKNTTKAARALKKAQRDMMGFDKMNKLTKREKSSSSPSGSGGSGKAGKVGGGGVSGMNFGGVNNGMEENSTKSLKLGKNWDALRKAVGRLKEAFGGFWNLMKSAGKWVLENILKPLGKWTISKLLPSLIDILAGAFRVLTKVLEALAPVWQVIWDKVFKPLAKFAGKVVIAILTGIAGALEMIAAFAEKHPKIFQAIVVGLAALATASLLAHKVINPLRVAIKNAGGAMQFLGKFLKPKHPIILALLAIVVAAGLIYKNWDKIKKTKFGQFLIGVGNALKPVGEKLMQVGLSIMKWVLPRIKHLIYKFKEFLPKIKETAGMLWDKFKPVLKKVGEMLLKVGKVAIKAVIIAFRVLKPIITTVAKVVFSLAKVALKFLIAGFKTAWSVLSKGIRIVKIIAKWIGGGLKKALDLVAKPLKTVADVWGKIKNKKATLTAKLTGTKQKDVKDMGDSWKNVYTKNPTMTAKMTGTKKKDVDSMGSSWTKVFTKDAKLTATVKDKASATLGKTSTQGLQGRWKAIYKKDPVLTATVKDNATKTIGKSKGSGLWQRWLAIYKKDPVLAAKCVDNATKILGKTKDKGLRHRWGDINKKDPKLTASAENKNPKTLKTIRDTFTEVPKEKKSKFTGKATFEDAFTSGYNKLANAIQRVRNKYPITKPFLPNIHPLAEGGWIGKNTPRLAIVGDNRHEGEIVSPESKLEAMAKKVAQESSGSDERVVALLTQLLRAVNSIDTNVYLDGKQIANNTVKQINQQTRTTGVSPLLV